MNRAHCLLAPPASLAEVGVALADRNASLRLSCDATGWLAELSAHPLHVTARGHVSPEAAIRNAIALFDHAKTI